MAPLSPDMELLGGRRRQHRWVYSSRRFFCCLLLDRARDKKCCGSGHLTWVFHQPNDRMAAGVPTRDSGMNDFITNTCGAGMGVLLYRTAFFEKLMGQLFRKSASDLEQAGVLKQEG